MPKSTQKRTKNTPKNVLANPETDGEYLLKLVLVLILGTLWLKFEDPLMIGPLPVAGIPIGLVAGLLLVEHFEKLQTDRKIWYVVLLLVTVLSYFLPAGIMV